jgi:hypothetical protein
MYSGNQDTASGFVLTAGEGQALWFPGSLTVTSAGIDPRAMPPAGQPPAVRRQPSATDRNRYDTQPHMNRERACPPMSQVRRAAVIGRQES